jgi:hypothetical protein
MSLRVRLLVFWLSQFLFCAPIVADRTRVDTRFRLSKYVASDSAGPVGNGRDRNSCKRIHNRVPTNSGDFVMLIDIAVDTYASGAYDVAGSHALYLTPAPHQADLDRAALSHCTLHTRAYASPSSRLWLATLRETWAYRPRSAPHACAYEAMTSTFPTPGLSRHGAEGLCLHSHTRRCP